MASPRARAHTKVEVIGKGSPKYKAKVNKVAAKVTKRQMAQVKPIGSTMSKARAREIIKARKEGRKVNFGMTFNRPTGGGTNRPR